MFELAGYETLDLIGGGGFGEVWLAAQNSTGRNVAVKVAHAPILDETLQIRFEREYKALGRLSGHPNIVDIVTAGTLADGRAYLVLEFIEGGTLWDRSQRESVEEDDLIDIGIELAKALKAAHNAGVLHRDVKPENVLLRDTDEAVLSDFGLAHLTDGATTSPNAVVASVAYAAPEILRGEGASTSTDIYGLGVCLLTAAIRSVPFVELHDKSIQTVIQRVLADPPQDVSKLGYSDLFNSLLSDLMAKDANDRPATADDALRRLEELPQLRGDQDFSWSDLLGAPETAVEAANSVTAQFDAIQVDESTDDPSSNDLWWAPDSPEDSERSDVEETTEVDSPNGVTVSAELDDKDTSSPLTDVTDDGDSTLDNSNIEATETDVDRAEDEPATEKATANNVERAEDEPAIEETTATSTTEDPDNSEELDDIDKLIFELTTSEQMRQDTIDAVQQADIEPEDANSAAVDAEPTPLTSDDRTEESSSSNSADRTRNVDGEDDPSDEKRVEPLTNTTDPEDPVDNQTSSAYLATVPVDSFLADPARSSEGVETTDHQGSSDTTDSTTIDPDESPTTDSETPSTTDSRDTTSNTGVTATDQSNQTTPDSTMEMPAITIGQPGLPIPNPVASSIEVDSSDKKQQRTSRVTKASAVNAGVQNEPSNADANFLDRLIDPKTTDEPSRTDVTDSNTDTSSKTDSDQTDSSDSNDSPAADIQPLTATPENDETSPFRRLLVGLAVLAGLSLATGLFFKAVLPSESTGATPTPEASGEATPLVLPLSIDTDDFPAGTIEATTPSLGPTSPLFCQKSLDASGMTNWKGSQFFTPERTASVEQLVVGFDSVSSAERYVATIEESLSCDSWNQTLNGLGYSVAATQVTPASSGDTTARFDLTASSTDGSKILGKTVVVQAGTNVAVIGVQSQDEDSFETLTALAEQASTSFSESADS